MITFRNILAAVDFSRYTDQVVEHAATLAQKLGSELVLIHVINQRDIDGIAYTYQKLKILTDKLSFEGLIERLHKEREKNMTELMARHELGDLQTRYLIRTGVPFQEIIKAAAEVEADLVCVADKGRTELVDTLVGSTAQKLVRRCPVTLVMVRQNKALKPTEG
ncbi:MAG: universal stress protein [bacterium]